MPAGRGGWGWGSGELTVQRSREPEGTREAWSCLGRRRGAFGTRVPDGTEGRGRREGVGGGADCPKQGKLADRFRSQGELLVRSALAAAAGREAREGGRPAGTERSLLRRQRTAPPGLPDPFILFQSLGLNSWISFYSLAARQRLA